MLGWDVELAKLFKDRDNIEEIGVVIGKVINPLPGIEISILNDSVIIRKEKLYICNSAKVVNKGDKVLLIQNTDEQRFSIIDTIKKAGE